MCQPQVSADRSLGSSVAWDCDGTLNSNTRTLSCASGCVASHMDDAVFKCLAPPYFPDKTMPKCVLLVCPGQEFTVFATVFGSVIIAEQKAPMMWLKLTCVCRKTAPQINNPPPTAHQSAVLLPSHQQLPVTIATVSLCRKVKSSATALPTQICAFNGYTNAERGLQFTSCFTTFVTVF